MTEKSKVVDTVNILVESPHLSFPAENLTILEHKWIVGLLGNIKDQQTKHSLTEFLNNFNSN